NRIQFNRVFIFPIFALTNLNLLFSLKQQFGFMNIVIIGTAHPYRGGLASFNERMAKELQEEGHEVTIYTFSLQYPAFLFPGKTQYSEEPAPEDIPIQRKVNAVNPLNWFKVGKELKKKSPDLIVIKYWLPFMGACF